jgi:CPA2 family monovalent cation:H+ antiporter-2
MPHDSPLISTIVAGLVLAFIFGALANRFRMPPLVGYLLAGVLVGPFTPGFVADPEIATDLSEIGVILLMFGVGLNFSLKDLVSVQAVAIPGSLLRIAGGTIMGLGLALVMGWSIAAGLVFGLALSVASTVVLLKALQDRHLIDSDRGRVAVGWVIVEDVAMVLALVLIPALATLTGASTAELHDPFVEFVERFSGIELGLPGVLAVTVIKLAAFVGFMLVVGRRLIPMVLHFTAHTGSRELFRLAVLAIALGVAAGAAYLFGVSLALGAFFAGMILSESELSHRAAQESLPLRDAFSVLFFVSVGMLFDPMVLITNPLPVLATLAIILFGKSILGFILIMAFGRPVSTALTVTAGLAQIGEFSFILVALGTDLGIMPPEARSLVLSGAILSIVLNPVLFWAAEKLRPAFEARFPHKADHVRVEPDLAPVHAPKPVSAEEPEITSKPTTLSGHTILIGYGRVGTVVGEGLLAARMPFVLIEDAEGRINAARAAGIEVIIGNAASPKVLGLANVAGATTVVVAIPNAFEAGQAIEQCRKENPRLAIIARAHSDEEEGHLLHLGANKVIMGEREIGLGLLELVNRDSKAVAEIAGTDAVAAALSVPIMGQKRPEPARDIDGEALLAAIEAAPVQHEDSGPAEPPVNVSAFGEEPDAAPPIALPPPDPAPEPELAEALTQAPAADILPFKARQPAKTPATPFNPEVAPESKD